MSYLKFTYANNSKEGHWFPFMNQQPTSTDRKLFENKLLRIRGCSNFSHQTTPFDKRPGILWEQLNDSLVHLEFISEKFNTQDIALIRLKSTQNICDEGSGYLIQIGKDTYDTSRAHSGGVMDQVTDMDPILWKNKSNQIIRFYVPPMGALAVIGLLEAEAIPKTNLTTYFPDFPLKKSKTAKK